MEVLRLFPAVQQFQVKNGALNTDGRLYVYLNGTDDLAECFDADGSRIAQPVILDNNGRAPGLFVDSSKVYRLVVQDRYGNLLFTVRDMVPAGGGAGNSLGKTYDVVSSDGSIVVDEFAEGGTTTFDLSLGIDTDDLKPSCLKASATPLTSDGQFVFAETAREGTLLSVDNGGKVRMEPAWYHFTATVELAYDGTPANEGRQVTLRSPLSSSVVDFDTSYAHRESIELSGDIHVDAANTEFPLGVTGLGNGIRAYLVGFDIHAVAGHGGNNEYRAGEGITIVNATRTISADFDSVQEKLVAGDNISIAGNVISAGNISQEQADWTEDDTSSPAYIKNKPDLGVYATRTEVNAGLATKQDTISDLAQIRAGAAAGSSAVQPSDLATVATTGDYGDLENRPDLGVYATRTEVNTGLAGKQDVIPDLSAIRSGAQLGATSVQPADLDTYATDAELAAGLATKQDVINDLSEIRSGAAAGATALQPSDVAAVATSGSYDDLVNKPSIPTRTSDLTNDSGFITSADVPVKGVEVDGVSVVNAQGVAEITMPDLSGYATTQALDTGLAGKQDVISDLSTIRSGAAAGATAVQPGDLATVATTGSYDDLSGRPDLSVYATGAELSAGLVAKQDTIGDLADIRSGAALGATSVQPGDLATVATTGSYDDLTGKPDLSIYAESSNLATVATTGSYDDLADKPTIPAAQVNSDWNASSGVAEILNKPTLSTVATTGDYDDLVNKPSIPAAQVNSDWTETDTASKAYIQNKPDLGVYATRTELTDGLAGKQDTVSDLATIRSGAALGATAVQPGDLPSVDQSYSSSSTNAQSGTAVAQAISGVDAVPDVTSSDNGKVLVANYSGGAGSYAWASTPPANAIILDSKSTWSDFHTPYSAGRKDIYYKRTSPYAPLDSRAELYLHLTAVSDVDGSSTNFTYALFEGAWQSGGVDYSVRCKFRYSGGPLVFLTSWAVDQSYSASSRNAQSGVAVAQAISAVNQVPSSTSADADKVLTVDSQGTPAWASAQAPISAGNGIDITDDVVSVDTSVVATQTDLAGKQDTISDLAAIRSGAAAGWTAVQPGWLATVATTGSYTDLSNTPSIPTATSDLTNDSGFITLSDVPAQVNADWNSSSGASEILNKPTIPSGAQLVPAATSADADKVLTVNSQGTPAWASAQAPISAGNGIDITNNVVSAKVDGTTVTINASGELEAAPAVTVDQTYNATSTNPQSGTAVAQAIATKEDAFDVGTGLEMDTSGATPTLQVEAPVDIVAGPGIVIDNPDGNTLRVSLREDYEEVLYAASTDAGTTLSVNNYITLSESLTHFEKVKIYYALQQSWGGCLSHEIFKVSGDQRIVLDQIWFREQSGYNNYWQTITFSKYSDTNLTITLVDGSQRPLLQNSWGSTGLTLTVFKVVGINRIANN